LAPLRPPVPPPALVVQRALQRVAAPPTRFGAPAAVPAPIQAKAKPATAAENYRLVIGAYLHPNAPGTALPAALAGHSFVAIEQPGGKRQAFGFSPTGYGGYDPVRDLGKLSAGVQGAVHDDAGAFSKPGVRTRSIPISADQARAAMAKIAEYRGSSTPFSATRRQCTTFAGDVAKAAGIGTDPLPNSPRAFYNKL
jgi:hypothetical protein